VLSDPTAQRWFDTAAFTRQPAFTRRSNPWQIDGLVGPRNWSIDATLSKSIAITERVRTELRMAAYNATNRLNRADPDLGVDSSTFGKALMQRVGSLGRQVELTLKVVF
jgi:hypothetical protein